MLTSTGLSEHFRPSATMPPPTSLEEATFYPAESRAPHRTAPHRGCRRRGRAAHREPRSRPDKTLAGRPPHRRPARPRPATPRLPFRRKKDMAGPGSGRRARGDCRGEGPAPLIQQLAGTSGSAGAAALARKQPLLPGVGAATSSGCPGSCCRHVINKPPARSSGPSARGASREAPAPPPPAHLLPRGRGARPPSPRDPASSHPRALSAGGSGRWCVFVDRLHEAGASTAPPPFRGILLNGAD